MLIEMMNTQDKIVIYHDEIRNIHLELDDNILSIIDFYATTIGTELNDGLNIFVPFHSDLLFLNLKKVSNIYWPQFENAILKLKDSNIVSIKKDDPKNIYIDPKFLYKTLPVLYPDNERLSSNELTNQFSRKIQTLYPGSYNPYYRLYLTGYYELFFDDDFRNIDMELPQEGEIRERDQFEVVRNETMKSKFIEEISNPNIFLELK